MNQQNRSPVNKPVLEKGGKESCKHVIWINGAFGVGKTSVAKALFNQIKEATLFDPEQVGYMLRKVIPDEYQTGDFQDLPLWRSLTVLTIKGLLELSPGPLIIPMTLVDSVYFDEVVGKLREQGTKIFHYSLIASPKTIKKRLRWRLGSPGSKRWAINQIDRCVSSLVLPEFKCHIDTENRPVKEIAEQIQNALSVVPP